MTLNEMQSFALKFFWVFASLLNPQHTHTHMQAQTISQLSPYGIILITFYTVKYTFITTNTQLSQN